MSTLTISEKRIVYTIPPKPDLESLNAKIQQCGLIIDPHGTVCAIGTFKNKPTSFGKLCECVCDASVISDYLRLFPLPIQIATGEDIPEVFENYRPGSCMRYECCRELRNIYALNDDKVVVAWWKKNSHPAIESHGSALVWLGRNAYIDRMYASSYGGCMFNHTILAIADAIKKYKPSIKAVKTVYHNVAPLLPKATVAFTLKLTREGYLPYMDSLCQCTYNSSSDTVRVSTSSGDFTAQEPDGIDARTGDDVHNCTCSNCGERIDEDDSRSNDDGETYCDSCYNELYSYCEYYEEYYPCDDVHYVEVLQRDGSEESVSYSSHALESHYHRYSGDSYSVDYIHESLAVECGGDYFACEDIADIDDPHADGDRWVEPYFADSHHRVGDCYWSDTMGGWSIEEEDGEFMDGVRRCPVAENGVRTRSLGPAFHIEVKEFSSRFYLIQTITGNQLRAGIGDLDTALRKSAQIISTCSVELPELWIDMDFANDPRWSFEHGHKLSSITTNVRN